MRLLIPRALVILALSTETTPAAAQESSRTNVAPPQRHVAVTFDDLPLVSRIYRDVSEQDRITAALVDTIRHYGVPAIGFVNEGKLSPGGSTDVRRVALLRRWVEARLELGNHTYSHVDLHRAPLDDYLRDIARGDSVTAELLHANGGRPRYFRHPYLHTGRDTTTQRGVERFLAARGYRIAPVTIDNSDYVFAAAYEHAIAAGNEDRRRRVAVEYVDYMERVVAYYEQQSVALFGREIPQVLLLHANALNADHFGAVAAMLRRRGYQFVPLDRALADPAYGSPDEYTGPAGITWLHRWAMSQGKQGDFFAGEPTVPEAIARDAAVPIGPRGASRR